MKGHDFIPHNTKVPFMSWRYYAVILSTVANIASIILFFTLGLNYGIDFRGGSLMEVQSTTGPISVGELRGKIDKLGLGDVQIQEIHDTAIESACSGNRCAMVRIELQPGGDREQQAALNKVRGALGDTVEYRNTEVVGPTVQGELIRSGMYAVLASLLAIVAYVWFRFEWPFAIGALVALFHDAILTIGLFSLLQMEFGLTIVAALLTIIGYSINDTVVVFDRIRENMRKYKKMPLIELFDLSINETMSRTILTSGTTLAALLGLYVFGGEVISGFTFAMIFGIFTGTYSSIFVAAPVIVALGVTREHMSDAAARKEVKTT